MVAKDTPRKAAWLDDTQNAGHRWEFRLCTVGHGESAGNVARDASHSAGLDDIASDLSDVDVPLSTQWQILK